MISGSDLAWYGLKTAWYSFEVSRRAIVQQNGTPDRVYLAEGWAVSKVKEAHGTSLTFSSFYEYQWD